MSQTVAARLERVKAAFAQNFTERGELGASVSFWQYGEELLTLTGGYRDRARREPWTAGTPVLFWSATKGMASACLLHACQERAVSLQGRVSEFWPEFGAAGKEEITIAEVLSHRAGLPSLEQSAPVTDYGAVVQRLAEEAPQWPRSAGHGYHPRTFGFLLDELVRRLTGVSLAEYWRQNFAEPLKLELWLGVPPERLGDVAPIFPVRSTPPPGDSFYTAFLTATSPTARAFASPSGLHSPAAMNTPAARTASYPAFGGIGTARALAKFYALLANHGALEGRTFFSPETLRQMQTTLTQGPDQILLLETAFSAGFMKDPVDEHGGKRRRLFGRSRAAFGQPGAGGSHAFADPETGLGFAYVMNQMEPGVLPNEKALSLLQAWEGVSS